MELKSKTVLMFIILMILLSDYGKAAAVTNEYKLMDADKILEDFQQGGKLTKVIVNLRTPEILLDKTFNWQSRNSLKQLHTDVKDRQNKVLRTFNAQELKLRNRFENQAAFSCEVTPEGLNKLLNDPSVEFVEPVYILQQHLAQGIPLINGSIYRSTYNGQGVAIAICDSGIDYNHPMLGSGGFPNSKVIGGYDFGDSDADPYPYDAHGTCCSGIAAGDIGEVNDYIGGVACGAKIYALKIKNSSGIIYSDKLIAAWDWCISHKNDNPAYPLLVISTSIGGTRYTSPCDSSSSAYSNAANNAVAAGITLFVSAGNEGYCDSIDLPACISNVISVGAVYDSAFGEYRPCVNAASCATKYSTTQCTGWYCIDQTAADKVTSYSNIASFLDILAPANRAFTTDISGPAGNSSGDYYADFGGTSAACPYAAGAAACIQSAAKELTGYYFSPARIRNVLSSTGDLVTDSKIPITKPRVNLGNAIESIMANPCADAAIGNATISWSYPMHTGNDDSRTQVIYLASELGFAGIIKSLSLYVAAIPGQTMNHWTIRMKHTTLNNYSSCSLDSTGWTTVYQANEPPGEIGWRLFNFSTPFEYNGIDNLMVDFSHNNDSYSSDGLCRYTWVGPNRSVYAYSNSSFGDPLLWPGSASPSVSCSTYIPNVLFIICSQKAGDFEPDGDVDIYDLAVFADQWLLEKLSMDIAVDGIVNFFDLSAFANNWQGDMNNLTDLASQWLRQGAYNADIAPPSGDGTVNFLDFAEFARDWMK